MIKFKLIASATILTVLPAIFSYLAQAYMVKHYGFESRGIFEYYTSIISIVSAIFSLNIYTTLNLYVAEKRNVPNNILKLVVVSGLIQCIATTLLLYFTKNDKVQINSLIFFILILTIISNHLGNVTISIFNGRGYFLKAKAIAIPGQILALVLLIFFVTFRVVNIQIVSLSMFAIPFVMLGIICLFFTKRNIDMPEEVNTLNIKELFILTWKTFIISASQIAFQKFFILHCISKSTSSEIGMYGFSSSIIQLFLIPITFISTTILSGKNKDIKIFNRTAKYSIIYVVIVSIFSFYVINNFNFKNTWIGFLSSPSFIKNINFMFLGLPFMAYNTLLISYQIRYKKVSPILLFCQVIALPVSIVTFELIKFYSLNAIPVTSTFVFVNIFLGIVSFIISD